jgi:signal transduction histidine kinase
MEGIKTALRADVFVAIDKSRLDAALWKQGQKRKPSPVAWDEFADVVVINRSLAAIPPPVRAYLAGRAARPGKESFEADWNGAVMQTMGVPFTNRQGTRLGELVVMEDITAAAAERRRTSIGVVVVAGTAGTALMLVFYVLLGRLQRRVAARIARLNDIDRVLASEQNERQRAEQELIAQLERIQQLEARGRMVEELAAANHTTEAALHRNLEITEQLRTTQSELVATARQAGRAEIATNVLHNVGNVLNSVNVSAGLMAAALRQSRLPGLPRALALMQDHAADLGEFLSHDEKGRLLPGYLDSVARVLAQEQERQMDELARLVKSIDHIKEIVTTQQSHAGGMGVIEPVNASDLAEDALRLQGGSLARHAVTVVREFGPVPILPLDRGRVLQILVNLVSNAKNAMSAVAGPHQLTLRIELVGNSLLRISVRDAGEGITPENLTRIFAHGFTTREAGHGFGLHSSALAARQMGGTLTAASEGAGKGATFTLELPVLAAA